MSNKQNRSSRWRFVRAACWERDRKAHAVCAICGQPICYSIAPSSTDDAWEPDHIVPFSKDDSLELDMTNIRPTHRRCNRARGTKNGMDTALGQQSRCW